MFAMKTGNLLFILISSVCLFIACGKDDDAGEPAEEAMPVEVKITEEPMQYANTSAAQHAPYRAAATTTNSLTKFFMDFYFDDSWNHYTFTKSGNVWSGNLTWPTNSAVYPITFYAYHDSDTEGYSRLSNSSNPYISVTVEENTNYQHDIIVASSKTFTYNERGSTVNLKFNHICSAVQFKICKTSGMSDYDIIVKEVKLCNVINSGDYYYKNDTWNYNANNTTDFTIYDSSGLELTSSTTELISGDDYMFMIPQTLTPWDKGATLDNTYIKLRCKVAKKGNYVVGSINEWGDAYLAVGDTWEQGKKQTITIQVGTALRNASGTQITKL